MKTWNTKYTRLLKKAETLALWLGLLSFSILFMIFTLSVQTWSLDTQLFIIPALLLIATFVEINMIESILLSIINLMFAPYHAKLKKKIFVNLVNTKI